MRLLPYWSLGLLGLCSAEPLSLNQALKEALEQSPQVQILKENRAYSEALVKEVGSVVYPKIEFNASAGLGQSPMGIKSKSSSGSAMALPDTMSKEAKEAVAFMGKSLSSAFSFDTDPRSNYRWGFSLSQPIYTFGKLSTAIEVSHYQDSATLHQYKRGMQDVQMTVVEAYAGLVLAGQAQKILESSQKRSKELRDFLKRNFDLGSGSKADLLRSEAALTQIGVKLSEANRDYTRAQMGLNQVMGRDLEMAIEVDTSLAQLSWMKTPLQGETEIFRAAKEERSDLKAIKMQGKIYAGGERIDKANYLPSIALQSKFGFTGYDDATNALKWENRDWSIGVGMTWTLFDGWANQAKASEKRIQSKILDQQALQLQRQMQTEISRLTREVEVSTANQKAMQAMIAALSESLDLTQRDFKSGKGLLSDLLGLEESLSQTRLGLLQARWQELRARAQLSYVQGRDLQGE